jgi:hypothetical protein
VNFPVHRSSTGGYNFTAGESLRDRLISKGETRGAVMVVDFAEPRA